MSVDSIGTEVKTWNISVNRLNKVWRNTFPSIIATFWLVTNSKEKLFIDKDIKNILKGPADEQLIAVFGRGLKDLINLNPLTYDKSSYPIGVDDFSHMTKNGSSNGSSLPSENGRSNQGENKVSRVIREINDFLVDLSKYKSVVNNLYKGIDVKLSAERKNLGDDGEGGTAEERRYYFEMSDFKYRVDNLYSSLDKISVRLICMSGLVLSDPQYEELKNEIKEIENSVSYLIDKIDSLKELMGRGKVLYDEAQRNKDLASMKEFLGSKSKSGFDAKKQELDKIINTVRDESFQDAITSALETGCEGKIALNTKYEVIIEEKLCYDLIYTDKGVIFPWPPKPESSLMIFDLYVTREAGSSFAISIPGFNLSGSSNKMVPVRRSIDDTHPFEQLDQKCSQIEEVLSHYKEKVDEEEKSIYQWLMIGTTFSRLQMALPRVVASIWGDQELYNKYAAITNSEYVTEGRKIIEIKEEVNAYLENKKDTSLDDAVSKEWLNSRGAKVDRLKNEYLAKVYNVKSQLGKLEYDFAIWLGLLQEGLSPEIEKEIANEVNKELIEAARVDSDGVSLISQIVLRYDFYWKKIVSSLGRSRYKIKKTDFYFDIWDIPEVIVLVDRIHNDLSYVTHIVKQFIEIELSKRDEVLDKVDSKIIDLLELFFKQAVKETSDRLREIADELEGFIDSDDFDSVAALEKNVNGNSYGKEFSKFVRVQAELSMPEEFGIYVKPHKMRQGFTNSSEVFLNPDGLSMPFPLRPSLDEIYQSWASSDAGIPTFTSTGVTSCGN